MSKHKIVISIFCMMLVTSTIIVFQIENVKATGTTLYVGGSGPGNYTKIQHAINAASEGDTIFVYNGTYHENLEIVGKNKLNIIGENKNSTIVDGDGNYPFQIFADYTNLSNFKIINATILSDWGYGVYLSGTYNKISNNIITENALGIFALEVPKPPMPCHDNVFENNLIFNNWYGIFIIFGHNNFILNNTIYNNSGKGGEHDGDGIGLTASRHNNISGNELYNDGIYIEGYRNNKGQHYYQNMANNTVNDKQLYYNKDQDNFTVPSNPGQIILVNCSNVTIDIINITETGPAIHLIRSSDIIISNSSFSDNRNCIDLRESRNIIIKYNDFFYSDGYDGRLLHKNNILLYYSENVIIQKNNISLAYPNVNGINMHFSDHNIVRNNTILSIDRYGVCNYYDANDNSIYHNNFANNQRNALDNCINNQWDNGYPSGGNYWGDYEGLDLFSGPNQDINGSDGIGDIPYNISGKGKNKDYYPLINATWSWNVPPNKPNKPSGNTSGKPGENFTFSTNTTDYDGDQVYYMWN